MIKKNKKIMLISLIIIIFVTFYFNFTNLNGEKLNIHENDLFNPEDYSLKSAQELGSYSGIGNAQNVTEFGEGLFSNNNLNLSRNENASIVIPNNWQAEEIKCDINELYEYDKKWINNTFDDGYDTTYWSTYTDRPENVTFGWYNAPSGTNDSIYIRFDDAGASWTGIYSYWNYTFNISREQIPFEDWMISFKYRVLFSTRDWLPGTGGAKQIITLAVDGQTQGNVVFNQPSLSIYENDTWYQGNINPFQPELYNLLLPGTITLTFGIDFGNSGINPPGYLEIYYDNITMQLSTLPKPSEISLNITDLTNEQAQIIDDAVDPIVGTKTLNNIWMGDLGGKYHYFSFTHNSSGNIIINSQFYSTAVSSMKTQTQLGIKGCEFSVENASTATWTYYFPVIIPGSYSNGYYFNISKPVNWNVTQLIDPYGSNKIIDVLETAGYGSTTLSIPNHIVSNGIWKVVAKAPNYIDEINIFKKVDSTWYKNATFQEQDQLKVNITIDTSFISNIENTNASLLLFYPNGTLWYQTISKSDINGFVEFSDITLGAQNTTIGEYTIQVQWNNYDANMTQVGLKEITFEIFHNSLLSISNFHQNNKLYAFSGDFIIFKVNYTDYYTGKGIENADMSYIVHNATQITGSMIYQGGGIYFADLDTANLQLGVYNITVSASKSYYQSHHDVKLFELEIQLYTTLIRIDYPTFVQMNDNLSISFLYKDSYDIGIPGAQITLDVAQEYIMDINDYGDGNYLTIINSAAFSGLGRHQITFNFSCLGYETQIDIIQFEIIEQNVDLEVSLNSNNLTENQNVNLYFTQSINITARAVAEIDNNYLIGGVFTLLSNKFERNLTESPISYYSTNIVLNGVDFNAGINFIYIRFEKVNYQTSIFFFQIFIRSQDINVSLYIDSKLAGPNQLLEKSFNNAFTISCRAYATIEGKFLTGGTMTFVNDEHEISIPEVSDSWFNTSIIISSNTFTLGPNNVYIRFEQANYTTTAFAFQVLVNQIKINVNPIGFVDALGGYVGDNITIKLRLTEENSTNFISNATLFYQWDFGHGYFKYVSNGTYQRSLNLQSGLRTNYRLLIFISMESSIFESKEYSIIITITQRPLPPYLIWIFGSLSVAAIGTLSIFVVRTKYIIPRKRKKETEKLDKIQVYKDVKNIQALMLIQKTSGLPIYTQEIRIFETDDDSFLVSGFIQAITNFSEVLIQREFTKYKNLKTRNEYTRYTIELDFNIFQLLVCDYGNLRILIFLREKSSERLKKQLYFLTLALSSQYSEEIVKFTGDISSIRTNIIYLINQFLFIHYIEPFRINADRKYVENIVNSQELTKMEKRLFNVILSITKENKEFNLQDPIEIIHEKNEDLVLEALDTLIKKKLIISTYTAGLKLKL